MLLLLIFILSVSFLFHIFCLIAYIYKKKIKFFKGFIATGLINLVLALGLATFFLFFPDKIQLFNIFNFNIDIKVLQVTGTGIFSLIMLLLQIGISIVIYRRSKNPENFHYNYFGKKVFHKTLVAPSEVTLFIVCVPCFLVSGAYFIAKIMNNFLGR